MYGFATQALEITNSGKKSSPNIHSPSGLSDLETSIRALQQDLPAVSRVTLHQNGLAMIYGVQTLKFHLEFRNMTLDQANPFGRIRAPGLSVGKLLRRGCLAMKNVVHRLILLCFKGSNIWCRQVILWWCLPDCRWIFLQPTANRIHTIHQSTNL